MPTTAGPLGRYEFFRTQDLDEARANVARILSPHRLIAPDRRSTFDICYQYVSLGDTSILYAEYGGKIIIDPGVLESFYLVGMPVAGTTRLHCDGQDLLSHPGLASVQSPTRPLRTEWSVGCRKITVKIGREALERHLSQLLGRPVRDPIEFNLGMELDRGPGLGWGKMIDFLLHELANDSALIAVPDARRRIDELLMTTLLTKQPHNYTDALLETSSPAAPACVRRVEEYVAADPGRILNLQILARVGGTSVRSLQEHFRRFRGLSPMAFVAERRLKQARKALREANEHDSVTDIALRCGFLHLGRFAQQYKARFGETPSQTLLRASGRTH